MSAALKTGARRVASRAAAAVTITDLPAVESHQITNRLYSTAGMQVGGLTWSWQAQCPSRIEEWVTLTASDACIHLALDGDAVGLPTEPFEWRSYDGDTRLLAWTARHEPLIELLRRVFRRDWVPQSLGDCDAPAQPSCLRAGFSVEREDGICVVAGVVDFDGARLHVPDPAPGCTSRAVAGWQRVPLRLPVILDELDIARAELPSFAPGCIVRLDNRTLATDRARVAIHAGAVRLIADIHQLQATVVGFAAASIAVDQPTCGGITMSNESPAGAAPGADVAHAVDAATLPVRLTFSAGRLVRRFGELAGVAPGYVFELDKRLDDQSIAINANDVPIALGELVCVGDLVGVRVTRMLARP